MLRKLLTFQVILFIILEEKSVLLDLLQAHTHTHKQSWSWPSSSPSRSHHQHHNHFDFHTHTNTHMRPTCLHVHQNRINEALKELKEKKNRGQPKPHPTDVSIIAPPKSHFGTVTNWNNTTRLCNLWFVTHSLLQLSPWVQTHFSLFIIGRFFFCCILPNEWQLMRLIEGGRGRGEFPGISQKGTTPNQTTNTQFHHPSTFRFANACLTTLGTGENWWLPIFTFFFHFFFFLSVQLHPAQGTIVVSGWFFGRKIDFNVFICTLW